MPQFEQNFPQVMLPPLVFALRNFEDQIQTNKLFHFVLYQWENEIPFVTKSGFGDAIGGIVSSHQALID